MEKLFMPVVDSKKRFLTESIAYGYRNVAVSAKRDNLEIGNSFYQYAWNFIDAEIKKGRNELVVRNLPRGGWKTILVYDPDTRFCFGIMSEDRLKDVKRDLKKRRTSGNEHYTDALIPFRKFIDDNIKHAQIGIFDYIPIDKWNNKVEELQDKILELIGSEIEQFILITFNRDKTTLTEVKARFLDQNFNDTCEPEDWNKFIPVEYIEEVPYNNVPVIEESNEKLANVKRIRKNTEL